MYLSPNELYEAQEQVKNNKSLVNAPLSSIFPILKWCSKKKNDLTSGDDDAYREYYSLNINRLLSNQDF